jgi:hypothetical protein
VGKTEDEMAEATIGSLANLATATSVDREVVTMLTEENSHLTKRAKELKEINALLRKSALIAVVA